MKSKCLILWMVMLLSCAVIAQPKAENDKNIAPIKALKSAVEQLDQEQLFDRSSLETEIPQLSEKQQKNVLNRLKKKPKFDLLSLDPIVIYLAGILLNLLFLYLMASMPALIPVLTTTLLVINIGLLVLYILNGGGIPLGMGFYI